MPFVIDDATDNRLRKRGIDRKTQHITSFVVVAEAASRSGICIRQLVKVQPLFAAGHNLGGTLGALAGGYFYDLTSGYELVWLSSVVMAVLTGLMTLFISEGDRKGTVLRRGQTDWGRTFAAVQHVTSLGSKLPFAANCSKDRCRPIQDCALGSAMSASTSNADIVKLAGSIKGHPEAAAWFLKISVPGRTLFKPC